MSNYNNNSLPTFPGDDNFPKSKLCERFNSLKTKDYIVEKHNAFVPPMDITNTGLSGTVVYSLSRKKALGRTESESQFVSNVYLESIQSLIRPLLPNGSRSSGELEKIIGKQTGVPIWKQYPLTNASQAGARCTTDSIFNLICFSNAFRELLFYLRKFVFINASDLRKTTVLNSAIHELFTEDDPQRDLKARLISTLLNRYIRLTYFPETAVEKHHNNVSSGGAGAGAGACAGACSATVKPSKRYLKRTLSNVGGETGFGHTCFLLSGANQSIHIPNTTTNSYSLYLNEMRKVIQILVDILNNFKTDKLNINYTYTYKMLEARKTILATQISELVGIIFKVKIYVKPANASMTINDSRGYSHIVDHVITITFNNNRILVMDDNIGFPLYIPLPLTEMFMHDLVYMDYFEMHSQPNVTGQKSQINEFYPSQITIHFVCSKGDVSWESNYTFPYSRRLLKPRPATDETTSIYTYDSALYIWDKNQKQNFTSKLNTTWDCDISMTSPAAGGAGAGAGAGAATSAIVASTTGGALIHKRATRKKRRRGKYIHRSKTFRKK